VNDPQEKAMRNMPAFKMYIICAFFTFTGCASPAMALYNPNDDLDDCGDPFQNAYGPFDYRTATPFQKQLVEGTHFPRKVEILQEGNTSTLGGDIGYTLRAFPNDPRALLAMVRLGQRDKTNKPAGAIFSVACFLERAVTFRPDDVNVWIVRGVYFTMQRRYDAAVQDFNTAIKLDPQNGNAHYDLGLAYFETKQFGKALEEAKLAKSLGFPLDGLKKKLTAVGQWHE